MADTLLNKRVQIRLLHENSDLGKRFERDISVTGVCVKRFLYFSYGYVIDLDSKLNIDVEGISQDARSKKTAKYVAIYMLRTGTYDGGDILSGELIENKNLLKNGRTKDGELHVSVRYVESPNDFPVEVNKSAEGMIDKYPLIGSGGLVKVTP